MTPNDPGAAPTPQDEGGQSVRLDQVSFRYSTGATHLAAWATPRPEAGTGAGKAGTADGSSPVDGPTGHPHTAGEPGVSDIDLVLAPGTLTLLCGPSGGGKTTLLRLLNGLAPHFHRGDLHGSVHVAAQDMTAGGLAAAARVSTTVFQNPRTQFFTTHVHDELCFRGENLGEEPRGLLAKVADAASQMGVSDLLERPLADLSGGELQKVACAQALVAGTPVVLLDEPTSNLSPAALSHVSAAICRLKHQGATIVVAEHRLHFLRGLADRVLRVAGGRITHEWTGEAFFAMGRADRRALGLRSLSDPLAPALAVPRQGDARPRCGDLVVEGLRHGHPGRPVLDIDHLRLPAGAVTALVGVNGAGKSTLARVLTGLAEARRGKVSIDGRRLRARARRARSALVMQDVNRQLFADSVRAEVALGAADDVDVDLLLRDLDLAEVAHRHPQALSGGQKQRLCVASALARRAHIHVWDEPTSGVDAAHLAAVADRLRRLAARGAVVLVITHDPELVRRCADGIVHLRRLQDHEAGGPQACWVDMMPFV
ncbi:ABC transporter ATP-binding protein [Schaalia sp. 19OD2882]|uniref:ABC transporter ATP-binding protein n=1 Tax=Schaalia sp. 19OD2882 TaxID=2794089 RepID=UPI001C1EDFC9|nr:ABC transporter ATP-binding protein [Schaalia sp. 19OD2882]QWW19395.1 ABC transporter ATP-binding protein [Schaalia sp. 19OD2882]